MRECKLLVTIMVRTDRARISKHVQTEPARLQQLSVIRTKTESTLIVRRALPYYITVTAIRDAQKVKKEWNLFVSIRKFNLSHSHNLYKSEDNEG